MTNRVSSDVELQLLRGMLGKPRISIVTSHPDAEVSRIRALIGEHLQADGRGALEDVLGQLLYARTKIAPAEKSLDLIGHSAPDGLLRLGSWVIDGHSPTVTAFFRGIADLEVLPRIGVTSLRLLGCGTAVTDRARATLAILSDLLGMQVIGTTSPIYSLHYEDGGFGHQWRFLLSSEHADEQPTASRPAAARRSLDIDALPLVPITANRRDCPRHVLGRDDARSVLALIDRAEGAQMPGLLAIPSHELALPAHRAAHCHLAEVILDGQFVRVYPDGEAAPGIVYPVTAPHRLLEIVTSLPMA